MTSNGCIHVTDLDSGDDAWVGVRVESDRTGVASSLEADGGEIEVFFGSGEARRW
jgi:hypothetical protein